MEELAIDSGIQITGSYADSATGNDEVSVTGAVYVPPCYVHLVMHNDLTPR